MPYNNYPFFFPLGLSVCTVFQLFHICHSSLSEILDYAFLVHTCFGCCTSSPCNSCLALALADNVVPSTKDWVFGRFSGGTASVYVRWRGIIIRQGHRCAWGFPPGVGWGVFPSLACCWPASTAGVQTFRAFGPGTTCWAGGVPSHAHL